MQEEQWVEVEEQEEQEESHCWQLRSFEIIAEFIYFYGNGYNSSSWFGGRCLGRLRC